MTNILITGVGGQGSVLLSRLIGTAAIAAGLPVRGAETIGMAQRGGSVLSHVRVGEGVHSPLIPPGMADLILAFEPAEAVRALPYLSKTGAMVVLDKPVKPITDALAGARYDGAAMIDYLCRMVSCLTVVDSNKLLQECGSLKVSNVALLGVALSLDVLPFSDEQVLTAMTSKIPARFLEINRKALRAGLLRKA